MELLAPTASAAALAALGVLLALYLYRRRRVRHEVASLRLWREVQREMAQHAGLKRLQRSASLLLHALALGLFALAVGGLSRRALVPPVSRLVLVVDTTASMGTREGGGRTRLDLAREQAATLLAAIGPGGDVTVIEAGCEPRVAAAATRELRAAQRALGALRVRDCGGDLAGAVALAADRARGASGEARVDVFTDGVTRAAELPAPAAARATLHTVGSVRSNAGITAAELRPAPRAEGAAPDARRSLALFVALEASASMDLEVRAELVAPGSGNGEHGRVVAVRRLALSAGRSTATLPVELAADEPADLVRIALPGDDALSSDDVAYAPVPRAGGLAVRLVVTGEGASPFVTRALRSDPSVTLTMLTAVQWEAQRAASFDGLTVFHGTAPPDGVDGNALAFGPYAGDRALGISLSNEHPSPRPTDVSPADPRVRYVTVDDLHVSASRAMVPAARDVALITSDAGALTVARDGPRGSVTVVGFDPHRTDWPLRTGFVLFLRDAVEYARARASALALEARRTGVPITVPARNAPRVRVTDPAGTVREVVVRAGSATLVDTDRVGIYQVDRGAGAERVGLSLFDPVESGLHAVALPLRAAGPGASPTRALERRDLSPWVFGLAAALLALEWLLHTGALRTLFRPRPVKQPVRVRP